MADEKYDGSDDLVITGNGKPLLTFHATDESLWVTAEENRPLPKQVIIADPLDAAALHSWLARKFNL